MTLKKVLAVILCAAVVLSVMTAVAYASNNKAEAAPAAGGGEFEIPSTEPTAPPTVDNRSALEKLGDWWNGFYPTFDKVWTVGFKGLSDVLVLGFRFLLMIVGLGTWGGPTWLPFF